MHVRTWLPLINCGRAFLVLVLLFLRRVIHGVREGRTEVQWERLHVWGSSLSRVR